MNLFALAIHLLFFPFGNDGYTAQSWDWVIWFGDCEKQCDEREEGYTCATKEKNFMHCYCWDCQRDCHLREARVNIDYCNAAASHVAQVEVDVGAHLASLIADLSFYYTQYIPEVGKVLVYPTLKFTKGVFEMGKEEKLVNKVIADVNARLDTMNKCVGQLIDTVQVEDQVDSMQRAFYLYDQARSHQGDATDQMEKLRTAWEEHVLVAHTEFDNVDKSAGFFGELLLPMQDFAQSFILVSFDYLIHVHKLDAANYEDVYERTIDAFVQLRIWADRARDEIKSSISDAMHDKPCKNGLAIDNQKSEWNAKFLSTHVYPIDSYIDRLAELNNAFTGDLFSWLGCYKDTGDRAMVHLKNGVTTTMECYDLCMQNGYSLFGLQYPAGGQCFCSNDKGEAMQFGESDSCDGHGRGGNWALDIYQVNGIVIGNVVLQYGVKYAIKSVSSGYYLDGGNQTYTNPVLTNQNPAGDKHLHWTIVQTNVENQFALKSVSSGFYLDGRDQNYNNPLTTNRDPTDDYYLQWTFEKTNGGTYATEYIGCYKDTANRALRYGPHQWGGYNPDTCSAACKDYKYFAVQAGGYCFCDDDYDHATRYGEGDGCPASKMGAAWRNDLFLNEMPNYVAIKSVSSQKYLDGRSPSRMPNNNNPLLTNGNPMDDEFLQWQFIAQ